MCRKCLDTEGWGRRDPRRLFEPWACVQRGPGLCLWLTPARPWLSRGWFLGAGAPRPASTLLGWQGRVVRAPPAGTALQGGNVGCPHGWSRASSEGPGPGGCLLGRRVPPKGARLYPGGDRLRARGGGAAGGLWGVLKVHRAACERQDRTTSKGQGLGPLLLEGPEPQRGRRTGVRADPGPSQRPRGAQGPSLTRRGGREHPDARCGVSFRF